MGQRCVVWGTHVKGQRLAKMAINGGFEVCAFCSSTVESQGKQIEQLIVISPERLKSLCYNGKIDGIIIGVNKKNTKEVMKKISDEFPKDTFIISPGNIIKNNLSQCKYSDLGQIIRDLSLDDFRYEFLFLHTMQELIKTQNVDSIVTGSSYGRDSIMESAFQNGCINFSLGGQDLYYCYLQAKKAIEHSIHKIKRCFIILGYYVPYQDLSMEKTRYGIIRDILYPLFNDVHNATLDLTPKNISEQDDIVKASTALLQQFFSQEGNTYYNTTCLNQGLIPNVLNEQAWTTLSAEEKIVKAQFIAGSSNKLLKYTDTLKENESIINQFVTFLESKQVAPIFVTPPFTKEYCTFLSPIFKKTFCDVLERLPYSIQYVDMNEKDLWEPDDFVDPEHMSRKGSKKFSRILNDMFCMES